MSRYDDRRYHSRFSDERDRDRDRDRDRERRRSRSKSRNRFDMSSGTRRRQDDFMNPTSNNSNNSDRDRTETNDIVNTEKVVDKPVITGRGPPPPPQINKSDVNSYIKSETKESLLIEAAVSLPVPTKPANVDPAILGLKKDVKDDVQLGINPINPIQPANMLVDYRETTHHFLGIRFIFECGIKLEIQPTTIATAAVLYHRFFREADEKIYDIYLIAAACICIAGKVEYEQVKIRDVVNVAYSCIHRNSEPLSHKDYFTYKNALAQVELHLMRMFQFKVHDIPSPHKYLVHYLYSLQNMNSMGTKKWETLLFPRTAWSLLQDFHYSPAILEYSPQAVALAALQLALLCHGTEIPLTTFQGPNSIEKVFYSDVDFEIQEEIEEKMLTIYDTESQVMSTVSIVQQNESLPPLAKEDKMEA